jgi:hypothetical protein
MSDSPNLRSFLEENKPLVRDYVETRLEIFRLQAIRWASQSAGYLVWIIISLFLFFLILLFAGIVLGCWLSGLTHSYTLGFGLTTGLLILLFALLAFFRQGLFVAPITQGIIRNTSEGGEDLEEDEESIEP